MGLNKGSCDNDGEGDGDDGGGDDSGDDGHDGLDGFIKLGFSRDAEPIRGICVCVCVRVRASECKERKLLRIWLTQLWQTDWQTGDLGKTLCHHYSLKAHLLAGFLLFCRSSLLSLLRPPTNWLRPITLGRVTCFTQNLLIKCKSHLESSRLALDQISGHYGPAKLTCESNHRKEVNLPGPPRSHLYNGDMEEPVLLREHKG